MLLTWSDGYRVPRPGPRHWLSAWRAAPPEQRGSLSRLMLTVYYLAPVCEKVVADCARVSVREVRGDPGWGAGH